MMDSTTTQRCLGPLAFFCALLVAGCRTPAPDAGAELAPYLPDVPALEQLAGMAAEPVAQAAPAPAAPEAVSAPADATDVVGEATAPDLGMVRRLRHGDKVVVMLRGIPTPEDATDVIDESGEITLSLVGDLRIVDMTASEAEKAIRAAYMEGGYYSRINVMVLAQEDEYFVRGEVKREGRYPYTRELTLLQAVTTAGGYTEYARPSRVKVIRGEEVLWFDLERIEKLRDRDPGVKPGDIIVVPRRII